MNMHAEHAGTGRLAVYPLWRHGGGVRTALADFQQSKAQGAAVLGVAAVLPKQRLDMDDMVLLESAGLLVVEVPTEYGLRASGEIAEYIEKQVDNCEFVYSSSHTSSAVQGGARDARGELWKYESTLDDQSGSLEAINDPAAQEGGP